MNLSPANSVNTDSVLKMLEKYREPQASPQRDAVDKSTLREGENTMSSFALSRDVAAPEPITGRHVNIWA